MSAQPGGFYSYQTVGAQHDIGQWNFIMRRYMATVRTATLCKVIHVNNNGSVAPAGLVDVQIIVNQMDGAGNQIPAPIVYNVPYNRVQAGTNAIIMDPQVGDMGAIVFGERDLSLVIANKAAANPGSNRRNSVSDGLFVSPMLNGTPEQYIQFNTSGITFLSPKTIAFTAEELDITAPSMTFTGNLMVDGNLGSTSGVSSTVPTGTGQTMTFTNGVLTNLF